MTLDTSQQRFGPILKLDYPAHGQSPAFSNPWSSSLNNPPTTAVACGNLFPQQPVRAPMSYGPMPVPVPSSSDIPNMNRMQTTAAAFADAAAAAAAAFPTTSSTTVTGHFAATPTASYDAMGGYAPAPVRPSAFPAIGHEADTSRRFAPAIQPDDRRGFADALDASHGMLAMSQETPRNIYGNRSDRSSIDSYGFPSTHSTSSSISSPSHINSYYGDSVSDYSTAGSDIENSRALPRLSGLMASHIPPAPQSMMGQFSSKVSSSTQKKHKCKVCDKRFTRPSSLQTHMYSHTGEKPFACEVEGCGRHFSVVSNLRRHRKVHRGDARSDAGSEDHHSD